MFCPKCGSVMADNATKCESCGTVLTAGVDQIDPTSWWISFLVPIAGAILYYVWKPSMPNKAKQANKASLMGCGTLVLLGIVLRIILVALAR